MPSYKQLKLLELLTKYYSDGETFETQCLICFKLEALGLISRYGTNIFHACKWHRQAFAMLFESNVIILLN